MRTLFILAPLAFVSLLACKKPSLNEGYFHVECAKMYPGIRLMQMDSTQTDIMYLKAFVGDGNFTAPVYTRQLNAKQLEYVRMYPDSSYQLDIPAIGKEYRIKNLRIKVSEMDYYGNRYDPTICKSYPEKPIVNGDSVMLVYGEYGAVYIPINK